MALGGCFCLLHRIMVGRGQFQIWTKSVLRVMYVQMVAVSFVTLVCSLSMSVIIADLAKRSI